jgi:dephospho-CoA kinase
MITFGLTGSICCGKSTVSKTFLRHGIPMVDADIVARQVVEPGTIGLSQVVATFGDSFVNLDGTLNRIKLGNLVFSNPSEMEKLNAIMGSLIRAEGYKQIKNLHKNGHTIVGWDAALLVENEAFHKFKPLIVVACSLENQLERLMKRGTGHGPLTKEQAMNRINSQMPTEEKIKVADCVISTDGTIEDAVKQTEDILSQMKFDDYKCI